MALFRRRSASQEPAEDETGTVVDSAPEDLADDLGAPLADEGAVPAFDRSRGPFDESESDAADAELPRLDLGSLRIPGLPGVNVQIEVDQDTQEVRAITAVVGNAAVQLQALAAPRSEGLWDELRGEIVAELTDTQGASVTEDVGAFGPELRAVVPARSPEGKQVFQPLRFTGVDGPRWFLRAVFMGQAAVHPDPEDRLHHLVRETIVVRGGEARPPRDPLPLRLPEQPPAGLELAEDPEGTEADAEADADDSTESEEAASRYADLNPFERGPEITEIR